jgi:16S rRNA (cytosine967-C5)-methyltransferase
MTSARLAAVRVLIALDTGRTTLSAEVERERPNLADRRDQALFLELAAGVTRWRAELDARIGAYSTRPVDELAPEVRAVLRVAAYQLHHLERIPEHALVHESVEIARALGQSRATGFVNAVLRNMVRGRQATRLPARPADPHDTDAALEYLSVTLSHPRWLVSRWLARFGFDACEQWCRFNNASPEITVRGVHGDPNDLRERLARENVVGQPSLFVPGAIKLPAGGLGRLSAETREAIVVQDEGSQLVACLAGGASGDRVLDVCASPGGKTLILDAAIGPDGIVIAGDNRPARVALLRSTLLRANRHARVLALNAEQPLPFGPVFDRVLLDAPCSGLGTLRRDPDIKWHRRPEDLPIFAASQRRMIERASEVVRPGGALIYATCSSEPEENEAIVDTFLAKTPEFTLGRLAVDRVPAAESVIDDRGMLHSSPAHGLDAFFAAVLVRRERA